MNARELRIGNNVFFKSDISGQEKILDVDWVFFSEDFWIRNSRPIPLTEDRILEFGFESEYTKVITNFGELEIIHSNGIIIFYLNKVEFAIDHVHTFQNLYFALTGSELTIKE